jgi:hypothetical protein
MSQTTFKVPAKFIIDGHAEACSTWKQKLERKFPALFTPLQRSITFKAGDRFTIRDSDFILAQTAPDTIALICLENGNRWAEPIKVGNSLAVTVEELTSICPSNNLVYKGKPVKQSTPTLPEFVEVNISFIKAAHSAATGELKKKVAAQFPELFSPVSKYVQLIKRPDENFVIPGVGCISLGEEGENIFMTIANGILPSSQEHLSFRSFGIFGSDVENVEVTQVGSNWIVAIKRK